MNTPVVWLGFPQTSNIWTRIWYAGKRFTQIYSDWYGDTMLMTRAVPRIFCLRGQTPQTFTGIPRTQTGFLVKHHVRKKKVFLVGATAPLPSRYVRPWWPSGWVPTWRPEPTETSVPEFCYKSVNLSLEDLKCIKIRLFLVHELFR